MHPNPAFRWEEDAALAFAAAHGFGRLFATTANGPRVAHTAFLLRGDQVHFHLSRANALASALEGQTALLLVDGPDGYVSPDWYESADQVPTWNYAAVEIEGGVHAMTDAQLPELLDALSAEFEQRLAPKQPWTRDKMDAARFDAMLGGIRGYVMQIGQVRGTAKLSQNKHARDRGGVIAGLAANGGAVLAEWMRGSA